MLPLIIPMISALSSAIGSLISDDKKPELQKILDDHSNQIESVITDAEARIAEAQASVINTEAKGDFLQRSWRPMLIYLIMFILFLNYGVGIIISFFHPYRLIELPPQLWTLIQICLPGYIALRSHEKGNLPGSNLINKIADKILR